MNQKPELTADGDVDRVLSLATIPEIPAGAMERLLAQVAEPAADNVLLFKPRVSPRRPAFFRYAAALPLAASLALGIYLGANGTLDFALPSVVTGDVAVNDDTPDDFSGMGEAEQYAEDNLS